MGKTTRRLQTHPPSVSIKSLRRLLSIVLLAILGLPMAVPLFAATATSEANLPACCRRSGKHHCMSGEIELGSKAPLKTTFSAPKERCPFAPKATALVHRDVFGDRVLVASFYSQQTYDAVIAQTESKFRISRSRSRQKRGPPALLFAKV